MLKTPDCDLVYSENPPYGHVGNTVTSLLRPFFLATWQNGHTFSWKKTSFIWSPVNTANFFFWPIGDRINGVPLYFNIPPGLNQHHAAGVKSQINKSRKSACALTSCFHHSINNCFCTLQQKKSGMVLCYMQLCRGSEEFLCCKIPLRGDLKKYMYIIDSKTPEAERERGFKKI